jgi:hypothetical protein
MSIIVFRVRDEPIRGLNIGVCCCPDSRICPRNIFAHREIRKAEERARMVIVATKRQSAIVSHWSWGEKFSPDRFSFSASSDSGKDTQSCLLEVVR